MTFLMNLTLDHPSETGIIVFFVILILVVFGWAGRRLWGRSREVKENLDRAIGLFDGIEEENAYTKIEELENKIKNGADLSRELRHSLEEFLEVIIKDDTKQLVYNALPAREFITDSIITDTIDIRFHRSVPNILTGLGVLGTFVGLAFGIFKIACSGAFETPENLTGAATDMLAGMAVAFITSIFGLGSGLFYSWLESGKLKELQDKLSELRKAIDSSFSRHTPEVYLFEILKSSRDTHSVIQSMGTSIASAVSESTDRIVEEKLVPVLQDLRSALGGNEFGETMKEAAERVREAAEAMKGISSSGAIFKDLPQVVGQLENVSRSIGGVLSGIEGSHRTQHETVDRIEGLLTNINGTLEKYENVRQRSEDSIKQIQGVSKEQELVGEKTKQLIEELNNNMVTLKNVFGESMTNHKGNIESYLKVEESLKTLFGQIDDHLPSVTSMFDKLDTASNQMNQASDKVNAVIETFYKKSEEEQARSNDLSQKLHILLQELKEGSDATAKLWSDYKSSFDQLREDLIGNMDKLEKEMSKGVTEYTAGIAQSLEKIHAKNDEVLAKAAGHLKGSCEELEELVGALSSTVEKYKGTMNNNV